MRNNNKKIETIFKEAPLAVLRVKNLAGAYIDVLNMGASLISIVTPDKRKIFRNVILHYDNPTDYLTDTYYLGSTIGRVANRLSQATFRMDGCVFNLEKNDGQHSNHGGFSGLNRRIFDYDILENEIIFRTESLDGEGGYPGNLKLEVSYSLSDNNEVVIRFKAKANKKTPLNLTNHAYFNLSGERDVFSHTLKMESDKFLEMNDDFTPTGHILRSRENPAYDFNGKITIGEMLKRKTEQIEGYNTYFIAKDNSTQLKKIATVSSEESGICMNLFSTLPGCMFYTGDYLSKPFVPFSGLCLEAQYYPDAPNHNGFSNIFLEPRKTKEETIVYAFSIL